MTAPWWLVGVLLLAVFGFGMLVDRALVARWMRTELDTLQAALRRREQLEQQPDELGRRIRDVGDVDAAVVVLTGLAVLAVVLLVQLGIRAGYL